MIRIALLCALALCLGVLPDSAAACSVCYGGAEESRKAFLLTTVLLSMLPLAMFGSLFWWFRRHFHEIDQPRVEASSTAIPVGDASGTTASTRRID